MRRCTFTDNIPMPAARLEVYIQPRASRTELAGMHGGAIKIRIAAPPVDNAANHALIDFLAQRLDVAKSRVRIISGSTSRRKVLEVDGITTDILAAKLGITVSTAGVSGGRS
jgi:uncharacterized protein